jgi:copper chaperone CopZ
MTTELKIIQGDAAEAGCACCATPAAADTAKEDTVSGEHEGDAIVATYTVAGMTCGHCVASVTEEVTAIDGVTGVHVDLATGTVTVTSAAPLAEADVRAAVDEAGYQLVG